MFGEIALADALTVLLLAPDVFWPLRRVGVEFHAAQDGKTAADSAFPDLHRRPRRRQLARRRCTVVARGALIRIENLVVDGRDGPAPDGLTAVLPPGSVTVLTGPNGAGKSTTVQVIAGLTRPTSGQVTVAGVNVTDLEPQSWWRQLAWLAQRPVLIPGTIAENLDLFGDLPDPERACRDSGFDEVLTELPDGPDTVVGRGGVGLSLGQRQRLGLARVLGSPAAVLLLDEPTAHLDPATEARVLDAIVERAASRRHRRGRRAPGTRAGHRRSDRRSGLPCPGLIRCAGRWHCCARGCRGCCWRSCAACCRSAAPWRWPVSRPG